MRAGRRRALAYGKPVRLLNLAALNAAVATASAVMFFFPPGKMAAAASWQTVRETDERLQLVFEAIETVRGQEPAAIMHYGSEVTWRHIFYYFASDYLLYLPGDRRELSMSFHQRQLLKEGPEATALPATRRVIILAPHLNPEWMRDNGWQTRGPLYWCDLSNTTVLKVGDWTVSELTDR